MNVQCVECESKYNVKEEKIPDAGAKINCPKCQNIISVMKPEPEPPALSAADLEEVPNPQNHVIKSGIKKCQKCASEFPTDAKFCANCGGLLVEAPMTSNTIISNGSPVQMINNNHLIFSCPYEEAFQIVENAIIACGVSISEKSFEGGLLKGRTKANLKNFGINVTASFYSESGNTHLDLSATLWQIADITSECENIIRMISAHILELAKSSNGASTLPSQNLQNPTYQSAVNAPSYINRAGPSHKSRAVTGFVCSLVGIVTGVGAILAIIFSSLALNGISKSTNKEGKGLAIAGLAIGIVGTLLWFPILLMI